MNKSTQATKKLLIKEKGKTFKASSYESEIPSSQSIIMAVNR